MILEILDADRLDYVRVYLVGSRGMASPAISHWSIFVQKRRLSKLTTEPHLNLEISPADIDQNRLFFAFSGT